MEKETVRTKRIWQFTVLVLVGLTLLAKLRTFFFGLDYDEQYAVTLIYRFAKNDLLVREMWEPHQTSVILPGLFARLWMLLFDAEYLLLFLRVLGCAVQTAISVYWYVTFREEFGRKMSFLSAMVLLNTLPKWIQTPEFANEEIWFLCLTLIFLYKAQQKPVKYGIFGGVSFALTVLSYPSAALLYPIFFICSVARKKTKDDTAFFITPIVMGLMLLGYVYFRTPEDLLMPCIQGILSDTSHSASLLTKLSGYGTDLVEASLYALVYIACAAFIRFVWRTLFKKELSVEKVAFWSLVIASVDQYRLWFVKGFANPHPQARYLLMVVWFVIMIRSLSKEDRPFALLTLYISLGSYVSILLLTNLDAKASLVHLLPAMLMFLLYATKGSEDKMVTVLGVFWAASLMIAQILLIRFTGGGHTDITFVKQKALYGGAKNVYCPYMEGFVYNAEAEDLRKNVPSKSKVLYIGLSNMVYTVGDYEVCAASTISTPDFDETYIDYFTVNPEKLPDYVVIDAAYARDYKAGLTTIMDWVESHYNWEERLESEYTIIVSK